MRYVCILTILFLTSLSFAQTRAFVIVDTSGISDSVLIRWNQGTRKFTTVPYASVAMDTSEVLAYTKSLISGGGQQYSDTTTWDATKTYVTGLGYVTAAGSQQDADTSAWDATITYVGAQGYVTAAGSQQDGDTTTWDATKTNLTAYQTTATGQADADTSTWDATKTNLTAYQTTATGQADADTSTWDATKTWAQPAEATLTDIADGTIAENLVNTANPWADNEIASSATWNTVGLEVGRQVGSVFVSKTFTNIGTSFVDVYVTAFDAEDMMIIDFTNADSVSAVFIWDYIGAGKQYVQWVDVADNSKILLSSLEMNGDADATRIEWAALPAWFVNKKLTIEWQGKSLTAADDPVAKGYVLYLK